MSSGQRKRGGGPCNSRPPRKRARLMASTSARASEAEPMEPGGSAPEELEDLPGPSSNPAVIDVDLDDSDESDDEGPESDESSDPYDMAVIFFIHTESDDEGESNNPQDMVLIYLVHIEIVQSGRHLVATICGHVFCNHCLYYSLMNGNSCPTCRTDLGDAGYHRLYI